MIRIVEGPTKLKLTGDLHDLKDVAFKMRYRPLNYFRSPKYQAYEMTDGREGWDGYISPITVNELEPSAICLRGHKDAVIATARKMEILVNTDGCIHSPFAQLLPDDLPDDLIEADFDLDQHQRESIVFWLKHGMGVNKIAVNGGKTAMFAATAEMIRRQYPEDRILYITQRERLTVQAYNEMKRFLPGWNITQYGGNKKKRDGDLVVCTIGMLWTNFSLLRKEEWFRDFIAVFYDESHHAASPTSQKLLMSMPCYFRFGASDTKREKDPGAVDKIRGLLGPIRYTAPVGSYIDIGRSAKPTIYLVENKEWMDRFEDVPHQAEPGSPAWALVGGEWRKGTYEGPVYELDENGQRKMRKVKELVGVENLEAFAEDGQVEDVKTAVWEEVEKPIVMEGYHKLSFEGDGQAYDVESEYCLLNRATDKAIITFKARNQMIVDWTRYYAVECKHPTLVVCTRTMHVLILETLLKEAVGEDMVQVLYGEHTTKQRDRAFAWFKRTRGAVLVSPLVQEGVSINELRAGVIADYVGDWERANQIIGRFIRKKDTSNVAEITWFIDVQLPAFRHGSRRVFKKLFDIRGYTFRHPVLGPSTIKTSKVYEKLDAEPNPAPWR